MTGPSFVAGCERDPARDAPCGRQIFSRVTLVPSQRDTGHQAGVGVNTKACTGAVAVDVSILPFPL